MMKKLSMALLCLGLGLLLAAPVGGLYAISLAEQAQYQPQSIPPLRERAYGAVVEVLRRDMDETVTLSGRMVSAREWFEELKARNPYSLRFVASEGDILHPGDLIAYDGTRELRTASYGILKGIHLGDNSCLRLESLEELVLECRVTDVQREVLQRQELELRDTEGNPLQVLEVEERYGEDGLTLVRLSYQAPGLAHGKILTDLKLTTGRVFRQALTVDASCVYQKGDSGEFYLRLVDGEGNYLSEAAVQTGYSNGKHICISGVEAGTLCDSGYRSFWEGGHGGA